MQCDGQTGRIAANVLVLVREATERSATGPAGVRAGR